MGSLILDRVVDGSVVLVGVPSDRNSSLLSGPAAAPAVIRSALFDPRSNMAMEDRGNLAREQRFVDAGDVRIPPGQPETAHATIVAEIRAVLARGGRVLALGGDHAISYPLVQAHADKHEAPLAIVQIDAHPDLYEDFEGNRFSHASGFARIMEAGLAERLVQVGIRASTPHQWSQAERFGVETIDLGEGPPDVARLPDSAVYLSLDLDGLDPAFAPGVSHPEPGGLSTREVIRLIQQMPGRLVGADLVELNPRRDVDGATALVAAKLVKEIAARLLRDGAAG